MLGDFSDLHLPCLSSRQHGDGREGILCPQNALVHSDSKEDIHCLVPMVGCRDYPALAVIREAERVPPTRWRKPPLGFQVMAALAFCLGPNMMGILVPFVRMAAHPWKEVLQGWKGEADGLSPQAEALLSSGPLCLQPGGLVKSSSCSVTQKR